MLVLSRDEGETVILTDATTGELIGRVVFVERRGAQARLGFEFGPNVRIRRSELIESSEAESLLQSGG